MFSHWPPSTNIQNYQRFVLSTQCTTLPHPLPLPKISVSSSTQPFPFLSRYQNSYLRMIKPTGKTQSSDHLCLSLPPLTPMLKLSDRSFRNASPRFWNSLPTNIRSFSQHIPTPSSPTPLPFNTLSPSRSQFLSRLKTHLFSL